MAESRNNPQETFFLGFIIVVGAIIVIATYFLQIVFFVSSLLLGAGLGFLFSRALGHLGRRWGHVGVLEFVVTVLSVRLLFGSPFAVDRWPGVFVYFGQRAPVSSGYRDVLWIVIGVTATLATFGWSIVKDPAPWNDRMEQIQNGSTQLWSKITELLFLGPEDLARRFFRGRWFVSYGIVAAVVLGLGALGFYMSGLAVEMMSGPGTGDTKSV